MTWQDAAKVGVTVIAGLGGGGVIVASLSGWIGRLWGDRLVERHRRESEIALVKLRADVDAGLKRLDVALGHQTFLMQRLAEMELEALRECWRKARACVPAINGPRAVNSGTDLNELNARVDVLRLAHNALLETIGKHEPFLPETIAILLEQVRQKANLELIQIGSREPFKSRGGGKDWWDEGRENQDAVGALTDELKRAVKMRIAELITDRSTKPESDA